MRYRRRWLEDSLRRLARTRPVVYVGGARQVGKTTLLRAVFPRARYVSFDLPGVQRQALDDPAWFVRSCQGPVILDEIQHVPELMPYVKTAVDERRRSGQWLLTGSQHYTAIRQLSETLAGRVGILTLPPFAVREWRGGDAGRWPAWMWAGSAGAPCSTAAFWKRLLRGMYPEPCASRRIDVGNWFESYIMTYLERDLRTQLRVGSVRDFARFLRAAALRTGQLVNFTDMARDVGIAVSTAREWVSVLEAGYHVRLLEPYHRNRGKRLVKSPKLYWGDTGLAAHLLGVRTVDELQRSPFAGALLENWVISEIGKQLLGSGLQPQMWFWRTSNGTEVDLIVEHGGKLWPCEVKAGMTARPGWFSGLHSFSETYADDSADAIVINLGGHEQYGRRIRLVNARCW